jgi:hypothetical protein
VARSSAKLKVVTDASCYDPRKPEDVLGFLFTREAALAEELASVRAAIDAQRRRYADAHKLCIRPRVERLRAQFGPRS